MNKIIIGNIISFFSSASSMLGCCSKSRKNMFLFQVGECTLLAIASVFFESYAAIAALLLSAVRNSLVARDKFTMPMFCTFLVLLPVLGIITNNRGIVGLLPVLATIQYTVCCYFVKSAKYMRFAILANSICWVVYSLIICDFSTALSDSIVAFTDLGAIIVSYTKKKTE